jgi:hypothetical protein
MTRKLVIVLLAVVAASCRHDAGPSAGAAAVDADVLDVRRLPDVLSGLEVLPTECEIHQMPLALAVAPVLYGYVEFTTVYLDAAPKEFPYYDSIWFGGCIRGHSYWGIVLQCSRCCERELEWERGLAAMGEHFEFDAAMRARLRARYERLEAPPTPGGENARR